MITKHKENHMIWIHYHVVNLFNPVYLQMHFKIGLLT